MHIRCVVKDWIDILLDIPFIQTKAATCYQQVTTNNGRKPN